MGNNPSSTLFYAARAGDVPGIQAALAAGGDINYRNKSKRQNTPLISASKHGHPHAVQFLLQHGAKDFVTTDGSTAMAEAARFGHDRCIALLLQAGSDHWKCNFQGKRPIDRAAEGGFTSVVRLIEARTCPFFATIDIETKGWLSIYPEQKWVVVHRAHPHFDNPTVDRAEYKLCIYTNQAKPTFECEIIKPSIKPLSSDQQGNVTFDVIPGASEVGGDVLQFGGEPHRIRSFRGTCNREIYDWLFRVLSETYASGKGPAFESNGQVVMPMSARAYAEHFAQLTTVVGDATTINGIAASLNHHYLPPAHIAGFTVGPGGSIIPTGENHHATTSSSNSNNASSSVNGTSAAVGAIAVALPPVSATSSTSAASNVSVTHPVPVASSFASGVAGAAGGTSAIIRRSASPVSLPPATATTAVPVAVQAAAVATITTTTSTLSSSTSSTSYLKELQKALADDTLKFTEEVPSEYICPITQDIMLDPVVAMDGHTYSREGISAWLGRETATVIKSPRTNEVMPGKALIPNHQIRGIILEWVDKHKVKVTSGDGNSATAASTTTTTSSGSSSTTTTSTTPSRTAIEVGNKTSITTSSPGNEVIIGDDWVVLNTADVLRDSAAAQASSSSSSSSSSASSSTRIAATHSLPIHAAYPVHLMPNTQGVAPIMTHQHPHGQSVSSGATAMYPIPQQQQQQRQQQQQQQQQVVQYPFNTMNNTGNNSSIYPSPAAYEAFLPPLPPTSAPTQQMPNNHNSNSNSNSDNGNGNRIASYA